METKLRNSVMQLGQLLCDCKGENTLALELSEAVSWARVCLISTCNSQAHMKGVLNQLRILFHEQYAMELRLPRHLGLLEESSWCPIDMGDIVLHLMSREAREFYELEDLWPIREVVSFA